MGIIAASRLRGTGINPLFENSEAYYKCDGTTSGVLLDSKNSFNGTLNGGITQGVPGFINDAVESDGTSESYLSIPSDTFDENNFSLSFWAYYSTNFDDFRIVVRGGSGGNNGGFTIRFNEKVSVSFFSNFNAFQEDSDLILNSFNQIIFQKVNNNISVYINNNIKVTGNLTYTDAGNQNLFFGVFLETNGSVRSNSSTTFLVDEIDIRKEQYTQNQRNQLYNNGNGTTI
jgi:hypothetical protein